jgi:ADP-heptose:LPS heptosyltransferase
LDRLDVPAAARQHLIVVNPNAGKELSPHLKRWPVELFADLSQQLLVQYPESVLIYTGVSDERVYVRSIIDRVRSEYSPVCHRMFDAAGHLSLGELVALFAQSFVFITIDSGPMHLASLVHAPSVCLFGAESFRLYGPLNPRAVVVAKDLYCIPMFTVYDGKKNRLSQNIPMQLITVDEVFEAVATLRTGGEFVESDAHHHSVVREMDAVIARAV